MEKIVGIYLFRNTINKKVYIGQSCNINERVKQHKYRGSLFYKAIKKYGWNNFIYEILETCEIDKLDEKESFYIEKYRSFDKELGYNLLKTPKENPVPIGSVRSKELKDKVSLSKKGKGIGRENGFYGKKHTEEFKNRQSENKKIQYLSIGNPFYGKKHTEETINKLKEIHKSDDMSRFFKKVIQINKDTNEVIKIWNSISDAAEFLTGDRRQSTRITKVCKGKYKTSMGFIWKYEDLDLI